MLVLLEGMVFKVVEGQMGGRKEGSKLWNNLTYQILADYPGRPAELENLTTMEEDPKRPERHPLLEAAIKSRAKVRILISVNADKREGRGGQLNTRIVDVLPDFDEPGRGAAPAKTDNGKVEPAMAIVI